LASEAFGLTYFPIYPFGRPYSGAQMTFFVSVRIVGQDWRDVITRNRAVAATVLPR